MQAKVIVTYQDGRKAEGLATKLDFMDVEDEFNISFQEFANTPRLKWTWWLAHQVMKRVAAAGEHPGAIKPDLRGWVGTIEDVDFVLEGDEGGPAPLDETTDSST